MLAAVDGVRALATSSAACARSRGYPDGEVIARDEMLEVVERICAAVEVPVTADLEAGYGDPAETARLAFAAGAAGMNLEDGNRPPEQVVEQVRAAREAAPIVLNARVDTFLSGSGDLAEGVERARAYLAAGADCVYPIMLVERDAVERFVQAVEGPVNVVVTATTPSLEELERIGVARVTWGSGLAAIALDAAAAAVAASIRG